MPTESYVIEKAENGWVLFEGGGRNDPRYMGTESRKYVFETADSLAKWIAKNLCDKTDNGEK